MKLIQGQEPIEPLFLKDYRSLAQKVIEQFRTVDQDNQIRRSKRNFLTKGSPARRNKLSRRKKTNGMKMWSNNA